MVLKPPGSFDCPVCQLSVYAFPSPDLGKENQYQCEEGHVFHWEPRNKLFRGPSKVRYEVRGEKLNPVSAEKCIRCKATAFLKEEEISGSRLKCRTCGQYQDVSVVEDEESTTPSGRERKKKKAEKELVARRESNGGPNSATSSHKTASVA